MTTIRSLFISAAFLSFLAPAFAEVGAKVNFPSLSDGHVHGARLSEADLRGKVVFFEYWGINCPPCRAAMPHLVEMQKKYGSKGLVIIGSHVQHMSSEVKRYLEENKVNFSIYAQKHLREAPCPGGIPYSVLIGADGRVIAEGYPALLYDKVEAAVAQVVKGYPILDGVELSKYKSLEKHLVAGAGNVEGRVEPLRDAAAAGDAEAQAICDAYDAWLSAEKERVTRLCDTNPIQALRAIATLKKSVPSVTEFDEQAQVFRQEPVYQQIAAVQKKVQALQKRQADGKRVSAGQIKSLRKAVEEVRNMDGKGVESLCDSLEGEIDSMADSLESAPRSKKGKRQKRRDAED